MIAALYATMQKGLTVFKQIDLPTRKVISRFKRGFRFVWLPLPLSSPSTEKGKTTSVSFLLFSRSKGGMSPSLEKMPQTCNVQHLAPSFRVHFEGRTRASLACTLRCISSGSDASHDRVILSRTKELDGFSERKEGNLVRPCLV